MDGSTPWPRAIRPAAVRKGTPNKATVRLAAKLAEAAERATAGLSPSEIASMMPVDVMLFAMRLELESGQLRSAASISEKAAPYLHAKMAPRAGREVTANSRSRSSEAHRSSAPRPGRKRDASRTLPTLLPCRATRRIPDEE